MESELKSYDIAFVCPPGSDMTLAHELCLLLRTKGYAVFWPGELLSPQTVGADSRLFRVLAQARDLLLILPPDAFAHSQVPLCQTITWAQDHACNILPLTQAGFRWPRTLTPPLDVLQELEDFPLPSRTGSKTAPKQISFSRAFLTRLEGQLYSHTSIDLPEQEPPLRRFLHPALLAGVLLLLLIGLAAFLGIRALTRQYPVTVAEKSLTEEALFYTTQCMQAGNDIFALYDNSLTAAATQLAGPPDAFAQTQLAHELHQTDAALAETIEALPELRRWLPAHLDSSPLSEEGLSALPDTIAQDAAQFRRQLALCAAWLEEPSLDRAAAADSIAQLQQASALYKQELFLTANQLFLPVSRAALSDFAAQQLPTWGALSEGQRWQYLAAPLDEQRQQVAAQLAALPPLPQTLTVQEPETTLAEAPALPPEELPEGFLTSQTTVSEVYYTRCDSAAQALQDALTDANALTAEAAAFAAELAALQPPTEEEQQNTRALLTAAETRRDLADRAAALNERLAAGSDALEQTAAAFDRALEELRAALAMAGQDAEQELAPYASLLTQHTASGSALAAQLSAMQRDEHTLRTAASALWHQADLTAAAAAAAPTLDELWKQMCSAMAENKADAALSALEQYTQRTGRTAETEYIRRFIRQMNTTGHRRGTLVTGLQGDTDSAALRVGDIIVAVNGSPAATAAAYRQSHSDTEGSLWTVTVLRTDGDALTAVDLIVTADAPAATLRDLG